MSSITNSLSVTDIKKVPKYCTKHNIFCSLVNRSVLKDTCLFSCEERFNSLSSTIDSLLVLDIKEVPKFCTHQNVFCTHANHVLLKGSCVYGCENKFNPLSLSQNSKSLLEPGGPTGAGDKEQEKQDAREKETIFKDVEE